jgi:hypothetical protein
VEYYKEYVIKSRAFELLNKDGTIKNKNNSIFTRFIGIQAAVLGGIKGHSYLKSCIDWYKDKHYVLPDGTYYDKILAPYIYADIAIEYGFRYKDELQKLKGNMVIYPSSTFATNISESEDDSYAIHCCYQSWKEGNIFERVKRKLSKNNTLRKLFGKKIIREL